MKKLKEIEAPKYWKLADYFMKQIAEGKLKPGDQLPSLAEMRRDYDASRTTSERMLAVLEKNGLIDRQSGYGIFVAQSLKPVMKGLIGLSGIGFRAPTANCYWPRLLQGVENRAGDTNSQIVLLRAVEAGGWEKVDGVLVSGWSETKIYRFIPDGLPVVSMFVDRPGRTSIVADEYSGMKLGVQHLIDLGHRKIAYLHGPLEPPIPLRVAAYRDMLHCIGVTPQENWMRTLTGKNDFGKEFSDAARRDMTAWLADTSRNGWKKIGCTALLCHNDEAAIGAMQALSEAGFKVPDDVSVVGFDGTEIGEFSTPRLTSVEVPLQRMGEEAVEMLQIQIAADEITQEKRVLPMQLRARDSCAKPARKS